MIQACVMMVCGAMILTGCSSVASNVADSFYNNLIVEDRYRMILDGLQLTLLITFCAALLGTLLGGLVCWMRMSRRAWLRQAARVYMHSAISAFCHKYGIAEKEETAHRLTDQMLDGAMAQYRPITVRITHSEQSLVTALDFMVEQMTSTPLGEMQRSELSEQCRQVVEEPTKRGFRVKLII